MTDNEVIRAQLAAGLPGVPVYVDSTCVNCGEQISRKHLGVWWHTSTGFLRCDKAEWMPARPRSKGSE